MATEILISSTGTREHREEQDTHKRALEQAHGKLWREARKYNDSEPTNWNQLLIHSSDILPCDLDGAAKALTMLPGKVAVEMHDSEQRNGIYLPSSGRLTPDVGTVVSVGRGTSLVPGDHVLCRPNDGASYGHFSSRDYDPAGNLKLFGIAGIAPRTDSSDRGVSEPVPWWDSIPATIVDGEIYPNGPWCKVQRDAFRASGEVKILIQSKYGVYSDLCEMKAMDLEWLSGQSGKDPDLAAWIADSVGTNTYVFKLSDPVDLLTFGLGGEADFALVFWSDLIATLE